MAVADLALLLGVTACVTADLTGGVTVSSDGVTADGRTLGTFGVRRSRSSSDKCMHGIHNYDILLHAAVGLL